MTSSPPILPAGSRWATELRSIRLRFGAGRLDDLPEVVRGHGGHRVLLVTDPGLEAANHPRRALAALTAAGLDTLVFDGVEENPADAQLREAARSVSGEDVDFVVALGGGSSMDAAKGINFLLTNGGRMEDYWGYGKATRPLLPAVALPTTGGTGSDAQTYALVSRDGSGRKMACGDRSARFREVILDPELTLTAPPATVAAAGMDAVSHALESHVTRTRNEVSSALSLQAWRLLDTSLERCLDPEADQLACRGRTLVAAHLAGAAIEASMLGAAHAAANPLTVRQGITHGVAVGLMLPAVVRFNAGVAREAYRELHPGGAEALAERIEALRASLGLPGTLRECGVSRAALPKLAGLASREWTAGHNPRPPVEADFLQLYEATY